MRRLVIVVAALVAAASMAGCGGGSGGYTLTAFFPKAVSLYDQSGVRVLGLPAGEVTDVEVEGTRVRVTMRIDSDVPVPREVNATIVPLSLIGERYVQLFPAWTEGEPRAADGAVIPLERTSVPVEPDEALAAVKRFLDTLDPDATGRLIGNLGEALDGNGQSLNDALRGLGTLTQTFADKDEEVGRIIDQFDDFTATLAARDRQLGRVLDGFAATTGVLAEERRQIEGLVAGLASLSKDGLAIVGEHGPRLERDIEILSRTLRSVQANINGVRSLLDAGPLLVAGPELDGRAGLAGAYDPKYHHLDLRTSTTPTLAQLFLALGLPPVLAVCLPVDVDCQPNPQAASTAAPPTVAPPTDGAPVAVADASPIDDLPGLVRPRAATSTDKGRGGWLRSLGRAVAEVMS